MKHGYAYIFGCMAIVGIGMFIMYYLTTNPTITPQYDNSGKSCVDEQKARELAEKSIGQMTIMSEGYQFAGIFCTHLAGANGPPALLNVKVFYQSNNPSAGELVVSEDPTLTKVINATVIPSMRTAPPN